MRKTVVSIGAIVVSSVLFGVQFHSVGQGLSLFAAMIASYYLGYLDHGRS